MADRRLFFGLWPDDRQRNTLRDQIQPVISGVEGNAVNRRNWHVTLVFIGAFPEEKMPELMVRSMHVEPDPIRLRLDKVTFWPRPKIACLQALTVPDELRKLKSDLEAVVSHFGIEPEKADYKPHITAVRNARPFEPVRLARTVELQWDSFELIESIPGAGGPTYRPVKQELL